jgi:hypothetical protein
MTHCFRAQRHPSRGLHMSDDEPRVPAMEGAVA